VRILSENALFSTVVGQLGEEEDFRTVADTRGVRITQEVSDRGLIRRHRFDFIRVAPSDGI
jgi:hypothetical protein